jgi:hypothetical protein
LGELIRGPDLTRWASLEQRQALPGIDLRLVERCIELPTTAARYSSSGQRSAGNSRLGYSGVHAETA